MMNSLEFQEIKKSVGHFCMYAGKKEENGNIRYFIEDSGRNKFFEIFVWKKDEAITKCDIHYDVHKDEKLLSWKKTQADFTHALVNPETDNSFGMKMKQTVNGTAELDIELIRREFQLRANETASNNNNESLLAILNFISSLLCVK